MISYKTLAAIIAAILAVGGSWFIAYKMIPKDTPIAAPTVVHTPTKTVTATKAARDAPRLPQAQAQQATRQQTTVHYAATADSQQLQIRYTGLDGQMSGDYDIINGQYNGETFQYSFTHQLPANISVARFQIRAYGKIPANPTTVCMIYTTDTNVVYDYGTDRASCQLTLH